LKERDSVRTPMQWSNARNGGFSSAAADRLILPVIQGGDFGYERVNVAIQQKNPNSLLNWLERAIRIRRRCPEFGSGEWEWLDTSESAVLAHCCKGESSSVVALHNFSSHEVKVEVNLGLGIEGLFDMLTDQKEEIRDPEHHRFKLSPYGYRWFRQN